MNNNIKNGSGMELTKAKYKQTEIGLIPEDWTIKKIVEISNPVRGGSPRPAGSPKYFNGDFIPWLTVASLTNISDSQIYVNRTNTFLTEAGSYLSRTLDVDTLIIANSGATLGVAKLLAIKCCANDGVAALLDINKAISSKYLVYFINSITKKLREDIATGNGQPNLNTELIGNISLPLPPTLAEQKAIATALSDVDELITNLDKLITKKKAIKQGAMQQLLTPPHKGGKRLAGFTGEWVETILGNVCEIRKGQLITESTRFDGPIPVIAGGKKAAYYHANANRLGKTITISGSGANAGYVAFHNYPIFASDCSTIEESPKYSIEYIYYLLSLLQKQIYNAQTGGAQPHIHPSDLNPMEVDIPKIEEQKAIAEILSDMDKEIEQLETKKAKYQNIKQGMMQELLTGKTRLV